MKITKVVDSIYGIDSDKYGLIFASFNRDTDKKQIRKIYDAIIREEDIDPIIVDKSSLVIIDGQHRYKAACVAWENDIEFTLKVIFKDCVDHEKLVESTITYNNCRKNWGVYQYLHCWAEEGIEDYKLLLSIFNDNKIYLRTKYSALITLLSLNGGCDDYRDGNFKIGNLDFNMAILEELLTISKAIGNTNILKPTLIRYYNSRLAGCDMEKRAEVLAKTIPMLHKTSTPPDTLAGWKEVFEECNIF